VTDEPFKSEILSMTTANPGWRVHIQREELDQETKERTLDHEDRFPVVAWAVVQRRWSDGELITEAEPVFLWNGSLVNATEYRRMHSDVDPGPGEPKVMVAITVEAPTD